MSKLKCLQKLKVGDRVVFTHNVFTIITVEPGHFITLFGNWEYGGQATYNPDTLIRAISIVKYTDNKCIAV